MNILPLKPQDLISLLTPDEVENLALEYLKTQVIPHVQATVVTPTVVYELGKRLVFQGVITETVWGRILDSARVAAVEHMKERYSID